MRITLTIPEKQYQSLRETAKQNGADYVNNIWSDGVDDSVIEIGVSKKNAIEMLSAIDSYIV